MEVVAREGVGPAPWLGCGEQVESPGLEKMKVSAGCGEEGGEFCCSFFL